MFLRSLRKCLYLKEEYKTYNELRGYVNSSIDPYIENLLEDINRHFGKLTSDRISDRKITMGEIKKEDTLMDWIDKMMSPTLNQFERIIYNDNFDPHITNVYNDQRIIFFELWTSGKCLLIREDILIKYLLENR